MIGRLNLLHISYVVQKTVLLFLGFPVLCSGCLIPLPVFQDWSYSLTEVLVLPGGHGSATVTLETLQDNRTLGTYIVGPGSGYTLTDVNTTGVTLNITDGLCLGSEQHIVAIVPFFDRLLYLPEKTTFITSFSTLNISADFDALPNITSDILVYSSSANTTLDLCSDTLSPMENILTGPAPNSKDIPGDSVCYQMELNGFEGLLINNVSLTSRFDISTNYPVSVLVRHTNWFGPVSFGGINNLEEVVRRGRRPSSSGDSETKLLVLCNEKESMARLSFTALSKDRIILYRGPSVEELNLSTSDNIQLDIDGRSSLYVTTNGSLKLSSGSPVQSDHSAIRAHDCHLPVLKINRTTDGTNSTKDVVNDWQARNVRLSGLFVARLGELILVTCLEESNITVQLMNGVSNISLATEVCIQSGQVKFHVTSFISPLKGVYRLLTYPLSGCFITAACSEIQFNMGYPYVINNITHSQKESAKGQQNATLSYSRDTTQTYSSNKSHSDLLLTDIFENVTVSEQVETQKDKGRRHLFEKDNSSISKTTIDKSALNTDALDKTMYGTALSDEGNGSRSSDSDKDDSEKESMVDHHESNDTIVNDTNATELIIVADIAVNLTDSDNSAFFNDTNTIAVVTGSKHNTYANESSAKSELSSGSKNTNAVDGVDPNANFVAVVNLVQSKNNGLFGTALDDWGYSNAGKSPPYFHISPDVGTQFDGITEGKSLLAIVISLASALAAVVMVIVIFFLVDFFSRRKQIRNTRIRPFVSYY